MKRWTFVILGLALLTLAGAASISTWRFRKTATYTDGVVVRLNAGGSHPQIGFATTSGDEITYAQGGLVFGYRTGERVRVLYDPKRPQATATLDRFGATWAAPLLLGMLGLGFVAIGRATPTPTAA